LDAKSLAPVEGERKWQIPGRAMKSIGKFSSLGANLSSLRTVPHGAMNFCWSQSQNFQQPVSPAEFCFRKMLAHGF